MTANAPTADNVTYPPLDTPKPVADNVWIVDSGPIKAAGMALPVRMTVMRLSNDDLLLCSPTRYAPALADELSRLGAVRHLIAPTLAHWMFLADWQKAYPQATTWAAPGLRDRGPVKRAGIRLEEDLSEQAPAEWRDEIGQGIVPGAGGFREVYFFHRATRTLILTDLIENLDPARLPPATRLLSALTGSTKGQAPTHLRLLLRLNRSQTQAAVRQMLALQPDRVIFAHGDWFESNGAARLQQSFAWLL